MSKAMDGRPIYQRILLKLSGEALQGEGLYGIDADKLKAVATEVKTIVELGIQVAIVIGGGNLMRGSNFHSGGMDRVTADQMGMLATIINGLALRDALDKQSTPVNVMSAMPLPGVVDRYDRRAAKTALQQGQVVIFVAGTGNPLVTTDSAAALRGIEIGANIVLKATKVDGVFASDPIKNPNAIRYDNLTYDDVIKQELAVMDLNAILLCRDNKLPLRVFNMNQQGALQRIMMGEKIGTLIKNGEPA